LINDGKFNKIYKRNSVLLLVFVIIVTCFTKLSLIFPWVEKYQWKYIMLPILWLYVIGSVIYLLPRIHPWVKVTKQEHIYFDAILCAMIYIGFLYIAAFLIYKVGKSPYDLTPKGIWLNFISVALPFLGIELIRGYVLGAFHRKKNIFFFLFITILMSIVEINTQKISSVKDMESLITYLAKDVGTVLCKNFLLSYLSLFGGAAASMLYGGLILVFHWFFPILPQLNWLGEGVIGIMVPVLELMYITNKYENLYINKRQAKTNKKDIISWIGTMTISVAMIWFVVGVFPIYPSVIATGSMKPLIDPGDVVLIKQFYTEEEINNLKIGDIILFQRDDIRITHRIIKIITDKDGGIRFETKGDNNSAEDARLVLPQEVKGKYLTVIPKIGYPTLLLKSSQLEHREDVEY
jgi:signal peptidase